ncbi:DUF4062 domain-containing protein [Desulfosporosinus sp. SB140]|uniref:DUF4062 domain-containing protein n=1 Tax=Desulfosporosinus paludis TaxID=3115649 RepID=UPI00388E49B3
MNIFLSSTYLDLQEERTAAIEVLDRVGKAYAMEKFVAYNHRSREACLAKLRECDALVLIIGERYGYIDDIHHVSITELEYRTANELGLPVFAFIKTDEHGQWDSIEQDGEKKRKHLAFKQRVDNEKTRVTFSTVEQLQRDIALTLLENSQKFGLIGGRLSAFQSFEQFYRDFLNRSKIFNHCFKLIGRDNYVDSLINFAFSQKLVAYLSGRGGIGKSKILFESLSRILTTADHPKILLLRDSIGFNVESAKELPEGKLIIVADDAHRIGGLRQLLAVVKQHSGRMKLILSTRPYGVNLIKKNLSELGFEADDLEELPEVKSLARKEIQQLAVEVLKDSNPYLVQSLINLSSDSPLITVIGGQLLTHLQITPAKLTNSEDFRRLVLDRFQDTITSSLSSNVPSQTAKEILNLVAALSPLRITDKELMNRSANLLGIKEYQLISSLLELERTGALLQRGDTVRITPDVLSDFILEEACFPARVKTGYSDVIFETFADVYLDNIFKNFAELDWRVSEGKGTNLLNEIWNKVWEYFIHSSDFQQRGILNTLREIAYFQPSETFDFILNVIENFDSSRCTAFENIPPILGVVATLQSHTRKAVNLLWQLGKEDSRDLNPNPDHGIRVLTELASYKTYKPLFFQEVIVTCIEEWVKNEDAFNGRYTPVDITDVLLVREEHEDIYEGFQISMYTFAINPVATTLIRNKVLEILKSLGQLKEERVKRRVLDSLLGALSGPLGMLGRIPSTEEKQSWIPEKIKILKIIDTLLSETDNPFLHCKAIKSLKPIANYSEKTLAEEIDIILEKFPNDFETSLIHLLWSNQPHWLTPGDYDYETARAIVEQESEELAKELINRFPLETDILAELERLVLLIESHGENCVGNYYFTKLAEQSSVIARQLCNILIDKLDSPLLICFSQFLYPLREMDNAKYFGIIDLAISKGNETVLISLAYMFFWFNDYTPKERCFIRKLALNQDHKVSTIAFRAVTNFPLEARTEVFQIVSDVDLGDDSNLANQVCHLFDEHYGIPFAEIPSWLVTEILEKLVPIKNISINDYEISKFLRFLFKVNPKLVAEWFITRIRYYKNLNECLDYDPVPNPSLDGIQLVDAIEIQLKEALSLVRDNVFTCEDELDYSFSELFSLMANGFGQVSLSVLSEWVDSSEKDKVIGSAKLLRYAGENFVFTQEQFIVKLLNKAEKLGQLVLKEVMSVPYTVAVSRGGAGTPGQPMPHQVQLKESAQVAASRYSKGSNAWEFYKSLQRNAEYHIEMDMKHWEERGFA